MKWLNLSFQEKDPRPNQEFYVDLDYLSNYSFEDLVSYIKKYEAQRQTQALRIAELEKEIAKKGDSVNLKSINQKILFDKMKQLLDKSPNPQLLSLLNELKVQIGEMQEELDKAQNSKGKGRETESEEMQRLMEENDELERKFQKALNRENVLQIEVDENKTKISNEIAMREVISAKNQNLEERVKSLLDELEKVIGKQEETMYHVNNLENEINQLKSQKGLELLQTPDLSVEQ